MFRKLAAFILVAAVSVAATFAGEVHAGYKVLAPISHGNLTIFPVVASGTHDTSDFLTLDEGLRLGEVVVTEAGRIQPLMRRHVWPNPSGGGEVNRLVLVNNSNRPLLLLAGEIVTGGKQDRVIGKDRIVPSKSDPIDLSVFCVEPGRWTDVSANFKGMSSQMAQPSVRRKAMAEKNQQAVWDSVRSSNEAVAQAAPAGVAGMIGGTTSYARVMDNSEVKKQVDEIAAPMQRDYQGLLHELRARNAVGVVAAVNGRILWADVFASTALLEKYWPKLVRSYAAEAYVVHTSSYSKTDTRAAQDFIDNLEGRRQVSEVEPGVFRQTEISGDGFKVFELTSLLPKTGFDLHLAKAAE
ncbi:MAG: ARPP-1 family domain-containing protein [Terriglobales bacterium]